MKQKGILIGKIYLILIGAFIILMSIDVLGSDDTLIRLAGGFFISALPGIALIVFVYFFWNRTLYLGIMTLVINTIFLILFMFLVNLPRSLPMIFVMTIPLYIIGVLFVLDEKKDNAE